VVGSGNELLLNRCEQTCSLAMDRENRFCMKILHIPQPNTRTNHLNYSPLSYIPFYLHSFTCSPCIFIQKGRIKAFHPQICRLFFFHPTLLSCLLWICKIPGLWLGCSFHNIFYKLMKYLINLPYLVNFGFSWLNCDTVLILWLGVWVCRM